MQETYDSMTAAASALKLPLHRLKSAKKAGCQAFRGSRVNGPELLAWLAKQPKARRVEPAKVHTSGKPEAKPEIEGLAASLRRLEKAEVSLAAQLQDASDPQTADQIRKDWLAVCEQLRRGDIALAESRRDSGEHIQRMEAEQILKTAAWAWSVSIPGAVDRICGQLRLDGEVANGMIVALRNLWLNSSAFSLAGKPMPEWVMSALRKGAETGIAHDPTDFEWRVKLIRVLLESKTEDAFNSALAQEKLEHERANRPWTPPANTEPTVNQSPLEPTKETTP